MSEIQDVIDQVVIQQNAVAAPSGEKDIQAVFDEPPAQISTFPAFVNIEDMTDQNQLMSANRHIVFDVNMHLLFAKADQKYSVRSRRRWIRPVLDQFGTHIQLGGTCSNSMIQSINYDPVDIGGTQYIAATFVLRVDMSDAFQAVA